MVLPHSSASPLELLVSFDVVYSRLYMRSICVQVRGKEVREQHASKKSRRSDSNESLAFGSDRTRTRGLDPRFLHCDLQTSENNGQWSACVLRHGSIIGTGQTRGMLNDRFDLD